MKNNFVKNWQYITELNSIYFSDGLVITAELEVRNFYASMTKRKSRNLASTASCF